MKTSRNMFAAAALLIVWAQAHAAPTAAQFAELGKSLTAWGAEKGGNADGTIPAYSGGLTQPPANYDLKNPGWRPDPFPNDKPLISINAQNMSKYSDKLSPGTQELMRKYPTYRIDIYPTRRSAAYPDEVLAATKANAGRCSLNKDGGLNNIDDCYGGFPFPIPSNGQEVIWNLYARYPGKAVQYNWTANYVKPSGEVVTPSVVNRLDASGFYTKGAPWRDYARGEYVAPASLYGQVVMWQDMFTDLSRQSWSYSPATRRVRLSPDLSADTPIAALGGAVLYDEAYLYDGDFDRFDFQLIGKQEMYIPVNNYKLMYADANSPCNAKNDLLKAGHPNPECVRWELRRVWHVKGVLKPGKRHVISERDLYIDEDAWYGGMQEARDASGKMYHVSQVVTAPSYEIKAPAHGVPISFDLSSGIYVYNAGGLTGRTEVEVPSANERSSTTLSRMVLKP